MNNWQVGGFYTYNSKEACIRAANEAKKEGFCIKYYRSVLGSYCFEILDPFAEFLEVEK